MKSSGATRGDYDPRGKYQEFVWAIFIINFLHYCLNGKTTAEKGAANCQYFKVMKRLECTHVWDVTHKSLN